MGITNVKLIVRNPAKPEDMIEETFLVDSGAIYSVVPKSELKKIGIAPHRTLEFSLADGTIIKRNIGDAFFEFQGTRASSPIIFGEEGDSYLLGAFTLEALGFVLDPFKRELRPMKLLMV